MSIHLVNLTFNFIQSYFFKSAFGDFIHEILILILLFIIGATVYYFYLKREEKLLRERMALDPELQIKAQELTKKEKDELKKWVFNPQPTQTNTSDVEVTEETSTYYEN